MQTTLNRSSLHALTVHVAMMLIVEEAFFTNYKRMIEINDLQTPFAYVHLVHRSIHWNHVKHTANAKYYQNYTVHFTQFSVT